MRVSVEPGKIDRAIRTLKRKMQAEGLLKEMRRAERYEKPSEKRRRAGAEAIRRERKAARRKAESV